MKKYLALFFIVLFCFTQANAAGPMFMQVIAASTVAAGGESVLKQTVGQENNAYHAPNSGASTLFMATQFTANGSYTITRIDCEIVKRGNGDASGGTGNIRYNVYDDDLGGTPHPDDPAEGSSDWRANSTFTAGDVLAYEAFTGFSLAITEDNIYWIGFESDTVGDGSNYFRWGYDTNSAAADDGDLVDSSANGSTWNRTSTDKTLRCKIYGY